MGWKPRPPDVDEAMLRQPRNRLKGYFSPWRRKEKTTLGVGGSLVRQTRMMHMLCQSINRLPGCLAPRCRQQKLGHLPGQACIQHRLQRSFDAASCGITYEATREGTQTTQA